MAQFRSELLGPQDGDHEIDEASEGDEADDEVRHGRKRWEVNQRTFRQK